MQRERTEVTSFSRTELERLACAITKTQIVGSLFIGEFHEQTVEWSKDGSISVMTRYSPGGWSELPAPETKRIAAR